METVIRHFTQLPYPSENTFFQAEFLQLLLYAVRLFLVIFLQARKSISRYRESIREYSSAVNIRISANGRELK
jgi:hypothetical protein